MPQFEGKKKKTW